MKKVFIIFAFLLIGSEGFAQRVTLYENFEIYDINKDIYFEGIDKFDTKSELNESIDTNYYRVYYKFDLGGTEGCYTFCVRLHRGRELEDEVIRILDSSEDTNFWGYLNIKKGTGYRILIYREDRGELLTSSKPFGVY